MADIESILNDLNEAITKAEHFHTSEDYDAIEISEIARRYWVTKELYDRAKECSTRLYGIYNSFDKAIFPGQLEKRDLDMVRLPDLARSFSIRTNVSASMLDRERAMEWLRDNGHGDLIQETVNAGTLASFARNLQIEHGVDLPEYLFKVTTYNSMGSSKYNPNKGVK